ncbi:MAG: hypothetical protein WD407_04935 [Rhodospirillales bacterium]
MAMARQANSAEQYDEADKLISESLVNLHLATAKAEAARTQARFEQIKTSSGSARRKRGHADDPARGKPKKDS